MRSEFFNRINRGAAASTAKTVGLQRFGGKFMKEQSTVKNISEGIIVDSGFLVTPKCACVMQTQGINRFGEPFVRKSIRVYVNNVDGTFDGAFVSLNINPDSVLQAGQWLDVNSVQTYKCKRYGELQPGIYADGTPTDEQPDEETLALIDIMPTSSAPMPPLNGPEPPVLVNPPSPKETSSPVNTTVAHTASVGKINDTQLKAVEELSNTYKIDFQSLLQKIKQEQGDFDINPIDLHITDERKVEIGDKGECYVYELLCERFSPDQIKWSNYAPNDITARLVRFNGKEYRLKTTKHDFDFYVTENDKHYYIEVKTTTGNIENCVTFPLIFEPKEWEWINHNHTENAFHYIVRVFDIENCPKAYFLKQELEIQG